MVASVHLCRVISRTSSHGAGPLCKSPTGLAPHSAELRLIWRMTKMPLRRVKRSVGCVAMAVSSAACPGGVKHHLLHRARIRPHEQHPAVAAPDEHHEDVERVSFRTELGGRSFEKIGFAGQIDPASKAKICFQSLFILMTVQRFLFASS